MKLLKKTGSSVQNERMRHTDLFILSQTLGTLIFNNGIIRYKIVYLHMCACVYMYVLWYIYMCVLNVCGFMYLGCV